MTTRAPESPVMVTGGRGRLGRLLVAALRAEGVRTASLARSDENDPDAVVVDLRDAVEVADMVDAIAPGAIVHLASVLRGEDLLEDNLLMDQAVAAASRRASTPHVINISSSAVYGTDHEAARREGDALTGSSAYARSKIRGEEIFRTLAREGTTRVTTLRVFNVAGPDFADSLVMRLLTATPEAPVSLNAPDRFVRDYLHQSDAIAIMRAVLSTPPARYRVLNVASGVAVSTRMLLEKLETARDRFVELPAAPSSNWADITRMTDVLGMRPHAVPTSQWAEPFLASE